MMHFSAHSPVHVNTPPPSLLDVQGFADEAPVVLRHLVTPAEIEQVLPLREGIDLSAHAAAGDAFFALEKKETNWVLSAPSSATAA